MKNQANFIIRLTTHEGLIIMGEANLATHEKIIITHVIPITLGLQKSNFRL